ncbi:MAG TPA: class I SAM-dependent methyltransferase [Casimicrobiaceae bacterium]|nr:class I SAM-dependent methyltransferase [Casimicrobiaceae bacterium]
MRLRNVTAVFAATLERYVAQEVTRETPLQARLRDETARLPRGGMQLGPDQGALLRLLVQAIGAKNAIEIGTFTGYSALIVAKALPPDGRLVCCDVSEEWTSIARRYWQEAGVADRIDLRIAPALQTLVILEAERGPGSFDFAFIDADKEPYDKYYESCLRLLRPGGIVVLDNVLWSGDVANPRIHDVETDALRSLNAKIRDDDRVDSCLLAIGDGMMLARKR